MKINESYKNYYLTCGVTKDNFIFENCSTEFLNKAFLYLSKPANNVIPINIKLTTSLSDRLKKTLNNFEDVLHKKLIARDFICSLIMLEIKKNKNEVIDELNSIIKAILNCNIAEIKKYHTICPMPFEITKEFKKNNFELNFFIENINDKFLTQAINNFVSSREPYSVKIFTNNNLSTYYDQLGNKIECPHDYINLNYQNFILIEK